MRDGELEMQMKTGLKMRKPHAVSPVISHNATLMVHKLDPCFAIGLCNNCDKAKVDWKTLGEGRRFFHKIVFSALRRKWDNSWITFTPL